MDKCELLARLTAGGPVADLPSPEINLIAASIAKLSEGKAPLTMGQKRLYIENWLTDNKEDVPAHVAGLNGGASLPESPPARSSAAPPEPVPPPASGGIGRSGDGLARSPPLPGSLARAAAAPPPPSSPAPPARGAAPPADLSSVHGILSTIGRYAGAPLSPHDVLQLADAIQRVDHTRQPATLSQKRVYVDDFFRAKTGAAIAGSAPEGTRAPSSSASPTPPEPDAPESGGALLEAVRAALARGGGRLGSAQEALTLAAAVHGFTGMPTDGSNPQEYVADWYNWVRHAAQPLPPPALPQLDDGVPLVEAACGRPARAAPSQAAAPDGGGAEGALWAMVSSLSSQVQSLSSQVATSREKTSEQQAALLQQQAAAQAAMARQALDAMQLAIQAAGGGGAQHRAGPDTRRGDESAGEADGEAAVEEEAAAPGPAPGSRADIEGQLLDYLRAQYEQGRDVPLDNLAKVCEHICALGGREVPKQLARRRELARAWYAAHSQQAHLAGAGAGASPERRAPFGTAAQPAAASLADLSALEAPRNAGQLLEMLHSVYRGDPDFEIPLTLVPKLSSSISELSARNAPKLIKDKRDFIKEYYRKNMALHAAAVASR